MRRLSLLLQLFCCFCCCLLLAPAASRPLAASPLIRLECGVCKEFVQLARRLVEDGQSTLVPEVARIVCIYKFKEAAQVCDGVVKLWKPMTEFVLERIYMSPENVCGQLLGSGCSNGSIPQLNESWNVTLPPTPKPPPAPIAAPQPGMPTVRVMHISDVHIDIFYEIGASADCGLPTCCRMSDGHPGKSKRKAQYWGDYSCDLPWWSLDRIFRQLSRSSQFDVIYFTGDLPDHHVWEQTRQQQVELYRNFTRLVRKYFPKVPFVAALGNHESLPVNSFPPKYIKGNQSMDWYYPALWDFLSTWVPADQKENVLKGGYFTQLLYPGFRIVSLNVNYGNDLNWWVLQNITDPDDQLQWLIGVLQQAEDKGEKVHILGHIPPSHLLKGYSWNYFKIANRYESTITGHFYGHTHKDSFGVFFDPENRTRAFGTVYVMGSLKTSDNPSYRVYEVDGNHGNATWQVLDHYTYVFNLTEANARGSQKDPQWFLEYQPTRDYGMRHAFPADWADLINRFQQSDQLFQKYYAYHNKLNLPPGHQPCIGQCKRDAICEMRNQRAGDRTFPC